MQGQTPSPPACLSVCLFVLSLFLYLPGLIAFPSRFFFLFLTFHVLVFFFLFFFISLLLSPFASIRLKKRHPAGRRGSTDVTVGGCVNTRANKGGKRGILCLEYLGTSKVNTIRSHVAQLESSRLNSTWQVLFTTTPQAVAASLCSRLEFVTDRSQMKPQYYAQIVGYQGDTWVDYT